MQARNRAKISEITSRALMNSVSDPRRLGGITRALGIVNRSACGTAYKEFFGLPTLAFRDLRDFFSSMLEEEAARLLAELGARMPDTSRLTVIETVRRLSEAV